jgi:hypothetical protein
MVRWRAEVAAGLFLHIFLRAALELVQMNTRADAQVLVARREQSPWADALGNSVGGNADVDSSVQRATGKTQVATNDAKYMPRWLREYAALGPFPEEGNLAIDEDRVLRFLRALRDRHVPAWQRLPSPRHWSGTRPLCCGATASISRDSS